MWNFLCWMAETFMTILQLQPLKTLTGVCFIKVLVAMATMHWSPLHQELTYYIVILAVIGTIGLSVCNAQVNHMFKCPTLFWNLTALLVRCINFSRTGIVWLLISRLCEFKTSCNKFSYQKVKLSAIKTFQQVSYCPSFLRIWGWEY